MFKMTRRTMQKKNNANMWKSGIQSLKKMTEKEKNPLDDFTMLSNFTAPEASHGSSASQVGLSDGRVGFMIVFDCHDNKGPDTVKAIHEEIESRRQQSGIQREPVVFIVANQLDRDVQSIDAASNREKVSIYVDDTRKRCKLNHLFYEETSAMELRRVKSVFRKMLFAMRAIQDIHMEQQRDAAENAEGADSGKGDCVLQ